MKIRNYKIMFLIFFSILLIKFVAAYGDSVASFSIPLAFILGLFSLFTPCVIALLPAYFGTIFKERKRLITMTLLFALGLATVLLPIGIAASFLGNFFIKYTNNFFIVVGLFLILMGIFSIFGTSFSFGVVRKSKFKSDPLGIYLFGIVFGISGLLISPCNGPVVLGITALIMTTSIASGILIFTSYILGIIFPLLILSYFFDKNSLENKIKSEIKFNLFKRKIRVSIPRFISGLIFIFIGVATLIYKGTGFFANIFFKIGIGSPVIFIQEIGNNYFVKILSIIGILIGLFVLYSWVKKRNLVEKDL